MANKDNTGKPVYRGPECRKVSRRFIGERRKEIRWEPKNPNRRQNVGRRGMDQLDGLGSKR